jgi:hypothetical protein
LDEVVAFGYVVCVARSLFRNYFVVVKHLDLRRGCFWRLFGLLFYKVEFYFVCWRTWLF